jgi:photosystem II stability/assembly factor-like uncharacterized protein
MECDGLYGASCDFAILDKDSVCAVISGKLYRTIDGGKSWVEMESRNEDFIAEHVFFSDELNGWISGVIGSSVCILSTSDGGKSYKEQFKKNFGSDWVETVGISFADKENGWFLIRNYGTFNGELYHTTNGGSEWNLANEIGGCRPYTQGIEAVSSEILWIPTHAGAGPIEGGLLYSEDAGTSFVKIGSEAEIVNSIQVEFLTPSLGFIIMNGYQEKYIMKSEDGGNSWVKISLSNS